MRPNIQISHQLNGRVKDFAAKQELDLDEAYREIIQEGIEKVENEESDG